MTNPINNSKQPMDRVLSESLRGQQSNKVADQSGTERGADNAPPSVQGVQSERLQALQAGISQTPDVDMARVDALRQSIAEGKYPIDADRIASRFVELERLLEP